MNTSTILMRLKRLDEAREAINEARTRKLEHFAYRRLLFVIALAQHDTTDMQRQLESIRKADGDSEALAREARVAVLSGRWHSSQEFDQRSQALSNSGAHATERSHSYQNIIDGALLGFCQPASNDISQLLSLSRISSPVQILFVPILPNGALCGNTSAAQILAEEQEKRYPDSTLTHVYSLPIIRAAIALQQERAEQAVDFLNAALPYDGGFAGYWPNYLRGQAYLRMHRGADAAMEFQKIIDHPGWDAESAMYPLAHLGLARAAILTGDDAKARSSFQEFLTLWKDADPDIPILLEARNEYGKLK
jgi:tetratricopeptide (TPR) repeat protein